MSLMSDRRTDRIPLASTARNARNADGSQCRRAVKTAIYNPGDMLLAAQLTLKVDTKVTCYLLWVNDITSQ